MFGNVHRKLICFSLVLVASFFIVFLVPSYVQAAYRDTIQAEGDALLYYWPMDESTGATSSIAIKGGIDINLTGVTAGAGGRIDGTALSFNGSNNSARTSSAINLTAYNKIVVEALVYVPSYTTSGRCIWEFSENVTNTPPDTFMFNIDGGVSGSEAKSNVALQGNGGYSIATYTRPSAGSWHHIVTVYNKGLATNEVDFYIDGVLQSPTRPYNTNSTNTFGNRILYLMARAGTSAFTEGKIQHLAIYSDLSEARILAHANSINTASAITLTGPTTGLYSASSEAFTVGANGSITGSIVVTPNDGGASGVFNPTSVTISSTTSTATFTYYPITSGARDISVTNDGGLTNPSPISYMVVAPATAVTLSGPTTGSNGVATSDYTVGSDNLVSGNVTVTPNDGGAGGTFFPTSVILSSGTSTATFKYTPSSVGSKTISVTNDGGLTNPSPVVLVVSAAPAYQSTIQAENTLLNYWPMTETTGTTLTALVGGVNINVNGATVGTAGKVGGTAVSFNGTSNTAQTASAIDLTAYNKVVVEALVYFNSYDSTFRSAWELGSSAINTGFGFSYDGGTGSGDTSNVYHNGPAGYSLALYTRPTVAEWHHLVAVYDRGLATNEVNFYIDGNLQASSSRPFNNNNTNYFGNDILYLMGRGGNTAYGNGKMQHLAIYSDLSEEKILNHANLINTASLITLTGPTSGINGSTSTNFYVSSDLPLTFSVIVTPNDGGAGGTFTPTSITISSEIPTATFTYTPSSIGSKTISITNDGGLSNANSITYNVTPNTPATTVIFSGPAGGSVNTTSTNFTISADGIITGDLIITPNDGGGGGTFTPTTVTISSVTSTATFTYTPSSIGSKTISITNNQALINGNSINYNVVMSGSGIILGDSTVATYAGGTYISSFLYTPDQISAGWTQTSIAVPGHTIAQQKTTYLNTANRATYDFSISQIGLNDMNPAEASSVAIARLQDLIDTINANEKSGALTIISTMIPCRERYIDVYGAVNGPIAWQKFLDINDAIKGNGPTPITGVDFRISDHFALLDDGNGNLNPIYDTGDHIHENNTARQIIARVWRDSLAELGLLEATTSTAPIIGTATAGDSSATVTFSEPQFNGGSNITSYTVISSPGNISATGTSSPIIITGLTSGVTYSFTVTATNLVGTSTASSASNQVTPLDSTPPTATISYSTTNPTNSSVIATITPSESVTVTNNSGLTTYTFTDNGSFTFEFIDGAGNTGSSTATVSNIDKVVPTITVSSTAVTTSTTATISWTTDEESSSKIDYGLTNTYTASTIEQDTVSRVTSHEVTISDLISCTNYHYRVRSSDLATNEVISTDNIFTTSGCTALSDIIASSTEEIATTTGGTLNLQDNNSNGLTLTIPVNFASSTVNFQANQLDSATVVAVISTPLGFSAVGNYMYQLQALSNVSTTVSNFDEPLSITITYDDVSVSGLDTSTLKIYRWNGSSWNELSNCSVNTNLRTVTCETTQFSTFGLFGSPISSINLPGSTLIILPETKDDNENVSTPKDRWVKTQDSTTVYFVDTNNIRHAYPNQAIWESYFGKDFSSVITITKEELANYPLGQNITYKNNVLIKIPSVPRVYVVTEGKILKWITSEIVAKRLYGSSWNKLVHDLSEAFFGDYAEGMPIE